MKFFILLSLIAIVACESPCLSSISSLTSSLKNLTHLTTWTTQTLRSQTFQQIFQTLESIDSQCKSCGGDLVGLKNQIEIIKTGIEDKDWDSLLNDVVQTIQSATQFYGSCIQIQATSFITTQCANSIVNLKTVFTQMITLSTWEHATTRQTLFSSASNEVSSIITNCNLCPTQIFTLSSQFSTLGQDIKSLQMGPFITEIINILATLDDLFICATNVSDSCLVSVLNVTQLLKQVTNFQNWQTSQGKVELLADLTATGGKIAQLCSQCVPQSLSLTSGILGIVGSSISQNWLGLAGGIVGTVGSATGLFICVTHFGIPIESQQAQ